MCKAKAFCSNSSSLEYAVICHTPPYQRNPNQVFYLEVLAQSSCTHYDPCGKSFSAFENEIEWFKMCMLLILSPFCAHSPADHGGKVA